MKQRRADALLAAVPGIDSLELARALIMEGRVMLGDRKILRAGEMLPADAQLRVRGELEPYVSRGAHKLQKALSVFGIDLRDRLCLDVGASTGGFTDVMLRAGARRVYAVDVGYNLLDYRLRSDPRVVCMERTNARFLSAEDFSPRPQFGATDVSFISLKAVLPAALSALEGEERRFVALVKPQFEAARADVGAKGVVRERRVHEAVLRDIVGFVPELGWRAQAADFSPIRGPEGNIEFLLDLVPEQNATKLISPKMISDIIDASYDKFLKSQEQTL